MTNTERAYAAGLFDGEGCVHRDNRGTLSVIIANDNRNVLEWVEDRWDGNVFEVRPGHFQWRANSNDAEFFLVDIIDHLIVKFDPALEAVNDN